MVIAQAARDRRAPGKILRDKWPYHIVLEAILLIDDVIWNTKRLSHAACIVNVVDGAAAPLHRLRHALVTGQSPLVPQLKREPDDVVALLAQQCRDGGGVHSSGHSHGDGVRSIGGHLPLIGGDADTHRLKSMARFTGLATGRSWFAPGLSAG